MKKIVERGRKASASGGGCSTSCRIRIVSLERQQCSSSSPDTSGVKEGGSRWERQTRQHTILWRGEYTFMGEEDPKNFDGVQFSLEIPSIT